MIAGLRLTIAGLPEVSNEIAFEQKQIEELKNMIDELQEAQHKMNRLENEKAKIDYELADLGTEMSLLKAQIVQLPDEGTQTTSG